MDHRLLVILRFPLDIFFALGVFSKRPFSILAKFIVGKHRSIRWFSSTCVKGGSFYFTDQIVFSATHKKTHADTEEEKAGEFFHSGLRDGSCRQAGLMAQIPGRRMAAPRATKPHAAQGEEERRNIARIPVHSGRGNFPAPSLQGHPASGRQIRIGRWRGRRVRHTGVVLFAPTRDGAPAARRCCQAEGSAILPSLLGQRIMPYQLAEDALARKLHCLRVGENDLNARGKGRVPIQAFEKVRAQDPQLERRSIIGFS